jgi:nucleoside diphosphate kinase
LKENILSEIVQLPYFDNELARANITDATAYDDTVIQLLSDKRIQEAASLGNLTLGMIRPNVGPNTNLRGLLDADCAELIEEMIIGLGIAAKFSFKFNEEIVDEFYSGAPQQVMEQNVPLDSSRFDSRWPEFKEFMASGPTTALLLYSPDGDAIQKWRDHLGHWNIEKFRDPKTIRGALGVNIFNNLVHGSDAPESVIRELSLIRKVVQE